MSRCNMLFCKTNSVLIRANPDAFMQVFLLPPLLKGSKPRKLTFIMGLWNLSLSVLSLFIVIGVGVPYFTTLWQKGLYDTVCDPNKVLSQFLDLYLFYSFKFLNSTSRNSIVVRRCCFTGVISLRFPSMLSCWILFS